MHLLVLSHACVTPINQQFFAEVEQQIGWQITILTPAIWKNDYGDEISLQRWPQFQGKLYGLSLWKSGSIPLHVYRTTFYQLLKEIQPDVIYVHHEAYAIATLQLYLANAASIRKPIGFYSAQNILKSYPLPFRQIEKFVFHKSSFAFPVSQSVAQVLRNKGYKNNMTVLPLGIDLKTYHDNYDVSNLKSKLKLSSDEVLIGYLGRITSEKGLKTLLHALKIIDDISYRLIVVGSGEYEQEFNDVAISLGLTSKIQSVGFVPHPKAPEYLASFDLLVVPSETRPNWKEQFGRVIIEAMACGTPVIGSDSGEIPYLINATQGGLIFPEGNAVALATQLRNLISDPTLRADLALKGRSAVVEKYTNTTIVSSFIQAISCAIN